MVEQWDSASSTSEKGIVVFMLGCMVVLGVLVLSNQEGVKQRATEVDRVQRDLIALCEEIHHLKQPKPDHQTLIKQNERLARERLHWTKPGEFVIRLEDQNNQGPG